MVLLYQNLKFHLLKLSPALEERERTRRAKTSRTAYCPTPTQPSLVIKEKEITFNKSGVRGWPKMYGSAIYLSFRNPDSFAKRWRGGAKE